MEKGKDDLLMIAVAIAFLLGSALTGYLGWSMMQNNASKAPPEAIDARGSSPPSSPSP